MSSPEPTVNRFSPSELGRRLARMGRLSRKELAEIFNDRRTIITLVLMPLLLYSLLSFGFRQFLMAFMPSMENIPAYTIGVQNDEQKRLVEAYLAYGAEIPWWQAADVIGIAAPSAPPSPLATATSPFQVVSLCLAGRYYHEPQIAQRGQLFRMRLPVTVVVVDNVRNALKQGDIDVGLRIPGVFASPDQHQPDPLKLLMDGHSLVADWNISYIKQSSRARDTVAYLEQHCSLANARQLQAALDKAGVQQTAVPVRISRFEWDAGDQAPNLSLTALVPLILILMTITGAVYPAIDLTAGERERGTLEFLVAAPVPRMALLFAKYIAVVTVAMLTATVNLTMMLVTIELNGLTAQVFTQSGITPKLVVQLFFLLVLFAAFFSAVLLALTSFARSFKEAQAYLVPLMLGSLVPGMAGMMPGLRLSGILCVTPLVNIVLLARDLAEHTATLPTTIVVVTSTIAYAVAAITVAARIFGAEAILFNEQRGWSDLFRRPSQARSTPTVSGALLCLAVLFPALFLAAGLLPQAPSQRLLYVALGSLLVFGGVPLAACLLARIHIKSCFQLARPPWTAWPAALLLAAGAPPIVWALMLVMRNLGLTFYSAQAEQRFRAIAGAFRDSDSAAIAVGAVAVVSIAEELFFRGFLFSALRTIGSQRLTIGLSALLFGLFHFVSQADRLVPSTLMGVVIGAVCWQTRSIFPGMLLHACFNALQVFLMYAVDPDRLEVIWPYSLIAAVPAFAAGAILVWRLGRNEIDSRWGGGTGASASTSKA